MKVRNLKAYPITMDEKIEAIEAAIQEFSFEKTNLIGDVRPAALSEVLRELKSRAASMKDTKAPHMMG